MRTEKQTGSGIRVALNFVVIGDGNLSAAEIAEALQNQADALTAKTKPVKGEKLVKGKKAKAKDEDDDVDSDSEADSDGDEDGGVSDSGNEDGEESDSGESDFDGDEDEDAEEAEEPDEEDGEGGEEESKGPSQKECIGLLKKLAEASSKKKAMLVMKKSTGKDSIYDVKDKKKYGALAKALKAAIKEAA